MVDVEKCVKEAERELNITEEEKEKFEPVATSFANFMNVFWSLNQSKE